MLFTPKKRMEFSGEAPAAAMAELMRFYQVQNTRVQEDVGRLLVNDPAKPTFAARSKRWHEAGAPALLRRREWLAPATDAMRSRRWPR